MSCLSGKATQASKNLSIQLPAGVRRRLSPSMSSVAARAG
jgi:hypothetical protein